MHRMLYKVGTGRRKEYVNMDNLSIFNIFADF